MRPISSVWACRSALGLVKALDFVHRPDVAAIGVGDLVSDIQQWTDRVVGSVAAVDADDLAGVLDFDADVPSVLRADVCDCARVDRFLGAPPCDEGECNAGHPCRIADSAVSHLVAPSLEALTKSSIG